MAIVMRGSPFREGYIIRRVSTMDASASTQADPALQLSPEELEIAYKVCWAGSWFLDPVHIPTDTRLFFPDPAETTQAETSPQWDVWDYLS